MFILKKLLAALLLPPCGPVLLTLAGLAILRWRLRLGRYLAYCGVALLILLATPVVSNTLLQSLESEPALATHKLAHAEAIVVLGGGSYYSAPEYGGDTVGATSLQRARYAAWLYRRGPLPILITGGAPFGGRPEAEAMQQVLQEELTVPVRWVENASRDTAENARFSATLLKAAHIKVIALVSHSWHLPRARALFEREGFTVIAAPTIFHNSPPSLLESILPSARALHDSSLAINEWLGRFINLLSGA